MLLLGGCIGDSSAETRTAAGASAGQATAGAAAAAAAPPRACVEEMSLMCCDAVHPVRLSGRPHALDATGLGAGCVPAGASPACEAPVCCLSHSSVFDGHQCELR
ncbi:MAG TPA: hypothetical protein VNO30_19920 [Kofleriaceae bacterium]|nr:hypothetical protein [Kofleriaceae bacterium]